jgi:DNA helicase-2/ATP-dependent DNA helicase PcrA
MSTPTPEQEAVLVNDARVRLVRAVPGSGKTWLVGDLIKKELTHWQPKRGGIAALSFTRVGGEEIRRAVGYDLQHPHFVGTIDAFLFRFIVRPFLKQVCPTIALPRLIPAEWQPKEWQKGPNNASFMVRVADGKSGRFFNLFNVCFLSENAGQPVIACKQRDWDPLAPLDEQTTKTVFRAKKELWERYGWLTHSDAAFLASKILQNGTHGSTVRAEILRRFPLVIVDELQDTGWFLGQCVLQLLAEPSVRGVLVGDPDQAIYEFNGARPDLFDRFTSLDGTRQILLGRTLRCGAAVCKVAEHLAQPSRCIEPTPDGTGRAFLLSYKDLKADVQRLRDRLPSYSDNGIVKIVARHTKTVETIAGLAVQEAPKLGSVPLNHLHRAVNLFRQGRQPAALAAARAALDYATFGYEGVSQDDLTKRGIDAVTWKRTCVESLLDTNLEVASENFDAWGKRVVDSVQKRLTAVVPKDKDGKGPVKIGLPKGSAKTKTRQNYLTATVSGIPKGSHVTVQTVHAVKGETHDLTVFVCQEPNRENRCPSVVWWSDAAVDQEERRIAFVAITRTRGDLIVCVSQQCFDRLQQAQPNFVRSFECMTIGDFIASHGWATNEEGLAPILIHDNETTL